MMSIPISITLVPVFLLSIFLSIQCTPPPLLHSPTQLDNRISVTPLIDDSFDWKLLKETLLTNPKENTVFSPFSIKLILTYLLEASGNNSETQNELSSMYFHTHSIQEIREKYKHLIDELLIENNDYTFKIGSKMFVDHFITPNQKFIALAKHNYNLDIDQLCFKCDPKKTLDSINSWGNNVTAGKIRTLANSDDIENVVMLIVNAIYFNGLWSLPFSLDETRELPFFKTVDNQVKAKFMVNTDSYNFFESTQMNAKLLTLPYKGDKFSMTIILPNAKAGLEELISEISSDSVKRFQWLMDKHQVRVSLPKVQFENKIHLKEILKSLGINEIFTEKASLPGLARGESLQDQLRLSYIYQKAGIVIDEKGSTVHAATVAGLENKFGGSSVEDFNANRPFLFFIEDNRTGTILFAGKITDPTTN